MPTDPELGARSPEPGSPGESATGAPGDPSSAATPTPTTAPAPTPVTSGSEPAVSEPDPVAANSDPVVSDPDPAVSGSEPTVAVPEPVADALARLVSAGTLTAEQAGAVGRELAGLLPGTTTTGAVVATRPGDTLAAGPVPASPPGVVGHSGRFSWTALLAEVGGYVGAAFVTAAVAILASSRWEDLTTVGRLAVLAVPAALLLGAAVLIARQTSGGWTARETDGTTPRRRLVAALLLVAGGLIGLIAGIPTDGDFEFSWVSATALVAWGLSYATCRGPVLHVAMVLAAVSSSQATVDAVMQWPETERAYALVPGITMLVTAVGWLALILLRVLDERALGLFTAGVLGFAGGQILTNLKDLEWIGFATLGAVSAACLVGYVATRYVAVLVVGVVTLAMTIPEAVTTYTRGALGASGALMVVGLSIVGASVLGLRLKQATDDDRAHDAADRPDAAEHTAARP